MRFNPNNDAHFSAKHASRLMAATEPLRARDAMLDIQRDSPNYRLDIGTRLADTKPQGRWDFLSGEDTDLMPWDLHPTRTSLMKDPERIRKKDEEKYSLEELRELRQDHLRLEEQKKQARLAASKDVLKENKVQDSNRPYGKLPLDQVHSVYAHGGGLPSRPAQHLLV